MSLVTRLPITLNAPAMPIIPASDLKQLVVYERDALDHWMLGGTSKSLRGLKAGTQLSLQDAQPTYNAGSVIVAPQNALHTPWEDSRNQTMCCVFKLEPMVSSPSVKVLMGTQQALTPTVAGGAGVSHNYSATYAGGQVTCRSYGLVANRVNTSHPPTKWMFMAFSEKDDRTALNVLAPYTAQAGSSSQDKPIPAGKLISVGNAYLTDPSAALSCEIAEFIYFDRGLTASEIAGVYARSKERMAARGITVV